MNSVTVRDTFLNFFKNKQHSIVPSASMVVKNDPTLLFINSGMAPFKEFFLGNATPKNARIADTQKCLRVSGKHNDLEEVGKDTYHHTMFEMLGNWSFGDYFKKEAINWAWELLTEAYKIDKEDIYVTVFEGDKADDIPLDEEALEIWKTIIPENRIIYGNKKDNFWEMGDQGPCGPSSEIHVDIRPKAEKNKVSGKSLVNNDHPQVVEIWNLVFMEYNRKADGSLQPLPDKHIDTGMGFERLCMVLQGVASSYDTDIFTPIIREIETITEATYGKNEETDIAIRVISDHVRAVAFAIADGQLPGNVGAGYVIRRILRRAVRYGFTFLNKKEPFIYRLVAVLTEKMGKAFPELIEQQQIIENVIKEEETAFLRTLDQGLILLQNIIDARKTDIISGAKAFELYDTYGFPIDLTALILNEKGLRLDEQAFHVEMETQKQRSKIASEVSTSDWTDLKVDKTQEFIGYDSLTAKVTITRYRKVKSKKDGIFYQLVFNITPFYPEGGGQVGDKGYIESSNGDVTYVFDTKKENNVIVHFTKELPDNLSETFTAVVDNTQRNRTAANHTATHLLHQALRTVLGTHVEQKGSAVHSKYLRFDFSHFSKLTDEELRDVENFVNARISGKLPLEENRNVTIDKALSDGAIALFGEKYGDTVRTIRFGKSIELCGGTHVKNTADIWQFKIISESGVAAGIRRIEAITHDAVKNFYFETNQAYSEIKNILNAQEPIKALKQLKDENAALKKQVDDLLRDKVKSEKQNLAKELELVNGVQFLAKKLDLDPGSIKDIAFQMGQQYNNLFLFFGSEDNGKAILSCYISKELVTDRNFNAGQIVCELGKHIQGGGGGQPFFATAGGKNPAGIAKALAEVKNYIE